MYCYIDLKLTILVVCKQFIFYIFCIIFCLDTKKIIFDEKDLIGKGSQGTLVYKWVDHCHKEGLTFTINHMIIEGLLDQ